MSVRVQEVFVASAWNGTALLSNGTDLATAIGTVPTVGNLFAFDGDPDSAGLLKAIVPGTSIPEIIKFYLAKTDNSLRQSNPIKKGMVQSYCYKLGAQRTPMAYIVDFTSATWATRDTLTFVMYPELTSTDLRLLKKIITIRKGASAAADAISLAAKINESWAEELHQSHWIPVTAIAVGDICYVHETAVPADWSGTTGSNCYPFKFIGSTWYDESIDKTTEDFAASGVTVSKRYYHSAVTTVTYNSVLKLWQLGTGLGVQITASLNLLDPAVTIDAAKIDLNGSGTVPQVKTHLRDMDWGYSGHQNRTRFQDDGWDYTVAGTIYDAHSIEYYDEVEYQTSSNRKLKLLTIYMPKGTQSNNLKAFIELIVGPVTLTHHI